jgi:hypothetical protein
VRSLSFTTRSCPSRSDLMRHWLSPLSVGGMRRTMSYRLGGMTLNILLTASTTWPTLTCRPAWRFLKRHGCPSAFDTGPPPTGRRNQNATRPRALAALHRNRSRPQLDPQAAATYPLGWRETTAVHDHSCPAILRAAASHAQVRPRGVGCARPCVSHERFHGNRGSEAEAATP